MIRINKFFIPYLILIFLITGVKSNLVISFIIVFTHEIVHYIVAKIFGFQGFYVEILPFGTMLKLKELDEASPNEDLIIAISAPIVNLILALIFYALNCVFKNHYLLSFFLCNLEIGIFNLVPAFPLDGGRILRDLLAIKYIYKKANKISVSISISIGIVFMFLYLFSFIFGVENFNLGIIAIFILVCSLKEKERIAYIIMGDIIKKKYKFIKRGYIENKTISVHVKKDLITILSVVDKNKYNIFTILDDDMTIIEVIYEEELLEALKKYGNITLEEYIEMDHLKP